MGIKKARKSPQFENKRVLNRDSERITPLKRDKQQLIPHLMGQQDNSGVPTLIAVFPAVILAGRSLTTDISFMLTVPALAEPFGEALLKAVGTRPNHLAPGTHVALLRPGFFAFLIETENSTIQLADISTSLLNSFAQWLNKTEKDGKARWSELSRRNHFSLVTRYLRHLKNMNKWRAGMDASLNLPRNLWAGADRRKNSVQVIGQDLMTRIRLACMKEVEETINNFISTENIFTQHRERQVVFKELPRKRQQEFETMLAYIDEASNGGPVPSRKALPGSLDRDMEKAHISYIRDVVPRFHPTARTLVPFVILMAIALSYNPDTLRHSLLCHYKSDERRFHAAAFKGRSGSEQPVSLPLDNALDHPQSLVTFLIRWSERLRKYASSELITRLFLYCSYGGGATGGVSSWGREGYSGDDSWGIALNRFRKDHQLEHFTLEMIRPTMLNVGWEISGGDPKFVQIQANHKSAQTSVNSYTSDAEKQRQMARLGEVSENRTRWREADGLMDPRGRGQNEDLKCATPGWDCADPYDSPYTEKGKLCCGYGRCPACPLGTTDLKSPLSFGYSISLLDAINRAQVALSPEAWFARLGPVKDKLVNLWLPAFHPAAIQEARKLHIPPMPMPE